MQVAIDKTCLKDLDKVKGNKLIYIFDGESLEELLKLNMHCVHKSKINEVEVNASKFKLNAIKTVNLANISELEPPKKKDYEFCIIIPNYNNDHGNIEGKTFLQKCIESVLNQTYKNFEIIAVKVLEVIPEKTKRKTTKKKEGK
nr:MAG TPA: WfgS-like protein [Caudoviricetes sp.]